MSVQGDIRAIKEQVFLTNSLLTQINQGIQDLVAIFKEGPPTGIIVNPGIPEDRPSTKERVMTKAKVKCVKGQKGARSAKKATKADVVVDFQILDTQDDVFTVQGTNSAGDVLDISTVATLTVTSSDPTLMSVDTPTGMSVTGHALKVGSVTLTFTATWNDGTVGPFTFDLPVVISAGGPTGLIITPGTPTTR